MPKLSNQTGHHCPRPGCDGHCVTKSVKHGKRGRWTKRIRFCPVCGAKGPTLEQNLAGWQFPLPGVGQQVEGE